MSSRFIRLRARRISPHGPRQTGLRRRPPPSVSFREPGLRHAVFLENDDLQLPAAGGRRRGNRFVLSGQRREKHAGDLGLVHRCCPKDEAVTGSFTIASKTALGPPTDHSFPVRPEILAAVPLTFFPSKRTGVHVRGDRSRFAIGMPQRTSAMTTIQLMLPDDLVQKATAAGLLSTEAIQAMLREQLLRWRLGRLSRCSTPIWSSRHCTGWGHLIRS